MKIVKHSFSYITNLIVLLWCLAYFSCKKIDDFLDKKNDQSAVVPSTLNDFQAILDNSPIMNSDYITLGLLGADNYYVPDANYASMAMYERNSYLWNKDIFEDDSYDAGYGVSYILIRNANIVLEGLAKITESSDNISSYNMAKGHALFIRAFMLYNLVNTFAKEYDSVTSNTDLGVPIRTTSDASVIVGRATVQQTYEQIISDLKGAIGALPINASFVMRPSKLAAYALLAKTYLHTRDYNKARDCCDSVLIYNNNLLDFSDPAISLSATYRFPNYTQGNREILYYAEGQTVDPISPGYNLGYVDTLLYNQYSDSDLRKTLFYSLQGAGMAKLIGTYTGGIPTFSGIATNEVFFIRAECRARLQDVTGALDDLNTVLRKRYKPNTFTDINATTADSALSVVLYERRKEFPATGQIRWEDLRRLNTDSRFAKTLIRYYQNEIYALPPGDPRYVYPFTINIIETEGIQQNIR